MLINIVLKRQLTARKRQGSRRPASKHPPARPGAPRPAPGAAARTGSPGRSARRSRADRRPSFSFSIRSAIRSMPERASRSARSSGWMSLWAPAVLLSSSLAGTFRKRKPRSASSFGSIAQVGHVIHREAEAAIGQAPRGLRARSARRRDRRFCVNSNISAGASARLASMKSRNCRNTAASVSVAALTLQNRPTSRLFICKRRVTCTQRKNSEIVDLRHQADAFGDVDEIDGRKNVAVSASAAATRLVVAHLALRQRDDRLQVEIDAVIVDRLGDSSTMLSRVRPPKRAHGGYGVAFAQRQRRLRLGRHPGGRHSLPPAPAAPAARPAPATAASCAATVCGDLTHQAAELADFRGDRIDGRSARGSPWRSTLVSMALSRRDISATWRARSAVPRDRSAIWSPRSVRSRRRLLTVLIERQRR